MNWSKPSISYSLAGVLARWARYDLIALDEVGCVLLFQVIAERAEKPAPIVITNLPFSEWIQVIPNTRPCKAVALPHHRSAHIIETGTESYRFRRTVENREGGL